MANQPAVGILRSAWIGIEARALRHLFARSQRRSKLPAHLLTGMAGELEAIFHLRRQGYIVVARRWRSAKLRGDLDLIAWEGATLCFIEVKTRSRHDAIPAEAAVDEDKQRTLLALARAYMRRLPAAAQQAPTRFDVLSIYLEQTGAASGESGTALKTSHLVKTKSVPEFVLYKGAFSWG